MPRHLGFPKARVTRVLPTRSRDIATNPRPRTSPLFSLPKNNIGLLLRLLFGCASMFKRVSNLSGGRCLGSSDIRA